MNFELSKKMMDTQDLGNTISSPIPSQGGVYFYIDKSDPTITLKKYIIPAQLVEKFKQEFGDENGNLGIYLTEEKINNFIKKNQI